ncbi:MAG: hypothetical protein NWP64_09910, partial [Maribacter sp.]|nr:hypothetical protein [Maribacter sp.]
MKRPTIFFKFFYYLLFLSGSISHAQVYIDGIPSFDVQTMFGAATWETDASSGDLIYNSNGGTNFKDRALMYTQNTYQSDDGFKLTINYTTGAIDEADGAHALSFGLISDETDFTTYTGWNTFGRTGTVYSLGANITTTFDANSRGVNFTNGTNYDTIDESGTAAQFIANASTEVVLEIGKDNIWRYYINGVFEDSGVIDGGFDLTKSYHVAVYGQDDNGGGKSIQNIKLERNLLNGERADWLRGTWGLAWTPSDQYNGNVEGVSIDPFLDQIKEVKTLTHIQIKLGNSYIYSPVHSAPHTVLESLWQGDTDANGDPVNLAVPRASNTYGDPFLSWVTAIKNKGLRTQAYINSSNMLQRYNNDGTRIDAPAEIINVTQRWKDYCDANYQTFIDSRPYHTGIYNSTTDTYDDASVTFPERKYMFCYAEYVIKEFSQRYGDLIDAWVFDSGEFMEENGDHNDTGYLEDQRIYEAFALAARSGNPNAAISFNNGPNRLETNAANGTITPFSKATVVDDYMFGHPYN